MFGERRSRSPLGSILTAVVVFAIAASCAMLGWLAYFALAPGPVFDQPKLFTVNSGQGLRQIAQSLEEEGLVESADRFTLLVRVLGRSGDIKAGSYEAEAPLSPLALLDKLTRGEFAQGQIRFIEGWTFRQVRAALDAHPSLRHDTRDFSAQEILDRLGIAEKHPEGLFFPDTYYFAAGTSDLTILRQAYDRQKSILGKHWERRAAGLPLRSPYEALVLASIVEKETGQPDEREMIAAVFLNRLRKGMRLQADPTVIYGLAESFDGNLRKRDLQTDQPYNSYTRYGLPPTPIALPGEAAIAATLNPASSSALYFVARGDGSHQFSKTLEEHNRAVNRFQRSGR